MGSGKSTVARKVADMTGLDFIDTDSEIERRTVSSIADLFDKHGEEHFREQERNLCAELERRRGVVIATGGGTLLDDANLGRFRERAQVFCLDAPVDVLRERLDGDTSRPLLGAGDEMSAGGTLLQERLESLLESRAAAYARIGRVVPNHGRTADDTAASVAAMVDFPVQRLAVDPLASLGVGGMPVRGRFGHSQIDIGRGALCDIGRRLDDLGIATRAFVMMPKPIENHFRAQVEASLSDAGIPHTIVPIEDGDASKNLGQVSSLLDRMIAEGAHRDSTVVAIGGGVTGDVAGFVAAMFMRGVPFVQVPTTLLAQVDASIGGKVGVNHEAAKNLIGSFYQPYLVISDPVTLRTLPAVELTNGMAEVVKSALIGSGALFEYIEDRMQSPVESAFGDIDFLEHVVVESAAVKCHVVNHDPFESNRRRILNLGHTAGHALEAAAGYGKLRHGEGVAIGIATAMRIAESRGAVDRRVVDRTIAMLSWCGLPMGGGTYDRDKIARAMAHDKKMKDGRLNYVLPTGIGAMRIVDDVTTDEIMSALASI